MAAIERPGNDEYTDYYAGYVALVPEGDILTVLTDQLAELAGLLAGLSDAQGDFRFAPGEWTIKEVVGHLVDGERAFGYRAFAFSRNEPSALPSFDQDTYYYNVALLPRLGFQDVPCAPTHARFGAIAEIGSGGSSKATL